MTHHLPRIDPEFKALIPPLSPEEYAQLEHNILAYKGCRDAIVTWDGIIVDGHNRFNICVTHSIPFELKEISFATRDEAKLWILDNQLGRRNLSDVARIELAMQKTELLRVKAKNNQIAAGRDKTRAGELFSEIPKPGHESINVHEAIAMNAGVSEGTLHNYKQLSKHPQLLEKVKSGELKIDTAHRLLEKEILKQLRQADKLYRLIERHIPLEWDEDGNQEIKSRLIELQGHLETCRQLYDNEGGSTCKPHPA